MAKQDEQMSVGNVSCQSALKFLPYSKAKGEENIEQRGGQTRVLLVSCDARLDGDWKSELPRSDSELPKQPNTNMICP